MSWNITKCPNPDDPRLYDLHHCNDSFAEFTGFLVYGTTAEAKCHICNEKAPESVILQLKLLRGK